jgi:hypothetical protein
VTLSGLAIQNTHAHTEEEAFMLEMMTTEESGQVGEPRMVCVCSAMSATLKMHDILGSLTLPFPRRRRDANHHYDSCLCSLTLSRRCFFHKIFGPVLAPVEGPNHIIYIAIPGITCDSI